MSRILVIEDDAQAREMLREMLSRAGYEAETAADGERGLRAQRARPFDLVITDILMPEKEGIETIIELGRDFPELPVIAISGAAGDGVDYLAVARRLGARHALAKPIGRQALLDAVAAELKDQAPG